MPIKVKKLNFKKGNRKLLTDISCEIKAKGITIILGPNGAGKTLFLKCLPLFLITLFKFIKCYMSMKF